MNETLTVLDNVFEELNLNDKISKLLEIANEDFKKFYYFLFDLNVPGSEKDRKNKSIDFEINVVGIGGFNKENFQKN